MNKRKQYGDSVTLIAIVMLAIVVAVTLTVDPLDIIK